MRLTLDPLPDVVPITPKSATTPRSTCAWRISVPDQSCSCHDPTQPSRPCPWPLISGGGTTLRNLLEKVQAGQLDIDMRLVISSNPEGGRAAVLPRCCHTGDCRAATGFGHPRSLFRSHLQSLPHRGRRTGRHGRISEVRAHPERLRNRVMNIHPGLIPAFCGKGFYGPHVHEGVLEYGAKVSGCTVHFANNQYDHGPIILQHACRCRTTTTGPSWLPACSKPNVMRIPKRCSGLPKDACT